MMGNRLRAAASGHSEPEHQSSWSPRKTDSGAAPEMIADGLWGEAAMASSLVSLMRMSGCALCRAAKPAMAAGCDRTTAVPQSLPPYRFVVSLNEMNNIHEDKRIFSVTSG